VFTLSGSFVAAVGEKQGLQYPFDVLQCASDGSFIVADGGSHNLIKLSLDGVKIGVLGKRGSNSNPTTLAALPGGAMLLRDCHGSRCRIIRDQRHRLEWMGVCVSAALV
jgi:hypothetical protein